MSGWFMECAAEVWEYGGGTHRCKRNGWSRLAIEGHEEPVVVCGSHFRAGLKKGLWLFRGNHGGSAYWYPAERLSDGARKPTSLPPGT